MSILPILLLIEGVLGFRLNAEPGGHGIQVRGTQWYLDGVRG